MKNRTLSIVLLIFILALPLGCSNKSKNIITLHTTALNEAEKITSNEGYTLASTESEDILIGDSDVVNFIITASMQSGYDEKDFNNMSGDRKFISFEIKEKSLGNEPVHLGIVVDKGKAIGAYLDYYEYNPGIRPITYKEFIRK